MGHDENICGIDVEDSCLACQLGFWVEMTRKEQEAIRRDVAREYPHVVGRTVDDPGVVKLCLELMVLEAMEMKQCRPTTQTPRPKSRTSRRG